MDDIRYPDVTVQLVGADGNSFAILHRVAKALRAADVHPAIVDEFRAEATSGNYQHLLKTVLEWVSADV